jgi:hypothetical protein
MGMEMFLMAAVTALLTVIVIDTAKKRRAFLCQQEATSKRR